MMLVDIYTSREINYIESVAVDVFIKNIFRLNFACSVQMNETRLTVNQVFAIPLETNAAVLFLVELKGVIFSEGHANHFLPCYWLPLLYLPR